MLIEQAFIIGNITVNPIELAIECSNGEKVSLQPKFIEVLCYLAKQYPRIVPRDEIIDNVWGKNSAVGEKALTNAIWHLRNKLNAALALDTPSQEAIETIRSIGYRLLINPVWIDDPQAKSSAKPQEQEANTQSVQVKKSAKYSSYIVYLVISTLLLLIGWQLTHTPEVTLPIIESITKEPGTELFNAPSPDGRFIVYQWKDNTGQANLYLKDRTQPQLPAKQLTFDDTSKGFSVWSHSGEYLYFARKDASLKQCDIIQLNIKTNTEKQLTSCSRSGGYYYIDISPNDKVLAFHGADASSESSGVYFLDLTTNEVVRFSCKQACGYRERDMAFSPDNKTIAISRRVDRFNENIFLVDLKTKQATQVTFNSEDIVGLTWHPSGKHLVFATQSADIRQGFVFNLATKKIVNLEISGFSYPAYAKKSGELFFQQRQETYQISRLPISNSVQSSPFPFIPSEFSHQYPDYSQKQNKITYISNESGFYELWLADTDGKNRQQLSFLQKNIRYPKWSHSGNKIAFLTSPDNGSGDKIHILDLATKKISQLQTPYSEHNRPTWSWSDNAIIATIYQNSHTDLYQFNIDGSNEKRLTYNNARYGIMLSDNTLLYSRLGGGLWTVDVDENQTEHSAIKLVDESIFTYPYSWFANEQGAYFYQHKKNSDQINYFDFQQQSSTPIFRLPKGSLDTTSALSFITNEQELLFTSAIFPQADIKKLTHPLLP